MNEIIVRDVTAIPLLLDENDEEMKFPTPSRATAYLRLNGYSIEDIRKMRFIYTNESRRCNCSMCEKTYSDCEYRNNPMRHPMDKSVSGLGKCPKLK